MVTGTELGIASVLGEWLCMRQELQEIPISSLRARGGGGVTELASMTVRP
jgi:hypothetical protein